MANKKGLALSEETIGTLAVKVTGHERRLDSHSQDIERIKNRLPNWASFIGSILTLILGVLGSALAAAVFGGG